MYILNLFTFINLTYSNIHTCLNEWNYLIFIQKYEQKSLHTHAIRVFNYIYMFIINMCSHYKHVFI